MYSKHPGAYREQKLKPQPVIAAAITLGAYGASHTRSSCLEDDTCMLYLTKHIWKYDSSVLSFCYETDAEQPTSKMEPPPQSQQDRYQESAQETLDVVELNQLKSGEQDTTTWNADTGSPPNTTPRYTLRTVSRKVLDPFVCETCLVDEIESPVQSTDANGDIEAKIEKVLQDKVLQEKARTTAENFLTIEDGKGFHRCRPAPKLDGEFPILEESLRLGNSWLFDELQLFKSRFLKKTLMWEYSGNITHAPSTLAPQTYVRPTHLRNRPTTSRKPQSILKPLADKWKIKKRTCLPGLIPLSKQRLDAMSLWRLPAVTHGLVPWPYGPRPQDGGPLQVGPDEIDKAGAKYDDKLENMLTRANPQGLKSGGFDT
ncbi:hypothetical protein BU25DRAFT_480521 [Macroventuria anomochaeta]|uniref:Uncharacterized protein n=1 Tax=Macroventuria anomochaeta TaxID=301207 RepID=A0ACB6RN24_9PLEO|nr:uncharacterized protein BU25DRAFT_480521 [Macroventuria anomochaeta]KAF2622508.1 hypothetical protein BU25DRAFT_480521 [Macroventuria anomochaeta]